MFFNEGAFRVCAVPGTGNGLRHDLLPESPSIEQMEAEASFGVELRGFEDLVAAMPGMAGLARLVTSRDVVQSRRKTGMNYVLFAVTADVPDKLPIETALVLKALKMVYTGISSRSSGDTDALVSMLLRLLEEGKDWFAAAEAVIAYYNIKASELLFNLAELLATLRCDYDDEEAAEKARQAVAEVSGAGCTRALICAAEAYAAQKEGRVLFLLQLALSPETLNRHFGVRRSLRRHETLSLELGMVMPLLLVENTRHLVGNMLVLLLDIPAEEIETFKSIASKAFEKIRLPDDKNQAPTVAADFVTRCVFEMVATHFKESDAALYREIYAESRGLFYEGDGSEGEQSLYNMVYRTARQILVRAADTEAQAEAAASRDLAAQAA